MSVKEEVLRLLNENKDKYLSGEEIAVKLGVSRTAVWKAVKSLNEDGYAISGINKMGYRMSKDNDVISAEEIKKCLDKELADKIVIEAYKSITSTNTVLKQRAAAGAPQWLVLVAGEQTEGRGRMNRRFYSPSDTGIYMSVLLRPDFSAKEALFITTMTAVAVSEAIDEICNSDTRIKWVNDIYYKDKKICGILTEAAVNVENAGLDYAVVGIGINVREPKENFPEDIKNVAGAILDTNLEGDTGENLRNRITSKVLENMYRYYEKLEEHGFMTKYKEKSMLIGRDVYILTDENKEPLRVTDIDDDAALVVKHADGSEERIQSGEVSVRIV